MPTIGKWDRQEEFANVPWQQGRLLDTPQTRRWSEKMKTEYRADEERMAFAFFTAEDNGCGRQFVAMFRTAEECKAAVVEHNRDLAQRMPNLN